LTGVAVVVASWVVAGTATDDGSETVGESVEVGSGDGDDDDGDDDKDDDEDKDSLADLVS
jgi:hypothetical protein